MKKTYPSYTKFLLTLILFTALISVSGFAQQTRLRIPVTRVDFTLTLTDGTVLDATKFYPNQAPPSGGWSSVVFCHGYGLNKEDVMKAAEDRATYGYYTLAYSMRGQGHSTGESNLISSLEADDFKQVVQYIRSQSIVNPNKVGAIGASQGGTIPFMAVCDPGFNLKCIVSQVGAPDMSNTWIENNSIKMTLLWSLSYDTNTVRYNQMCKNFRRWILQDTPDKWDSLKTYFPIGRTFIDKVRNCQTPMFISTVWQDRFFSTLFDIKTIDSLPSTTPVKYYFGTYDAHGADLNDNEQDFSDVYAEDWLDYWLDDVNNGVLNRPKFTYASSRFPLLEQFQTNYWTWDRFTSTAWQPSDAQNTIFYLSNGGRLRNVLNTTLPDTIGLFNNIKDSTLTMEEAVNREFRGAIFDSKFGKNNLIFDTPPMTANTRLVGTPKVNLHYKTNASTAQFNVQIWCVRPNGDEKLVTRVNYTDRNVTPNTIKQITFSSMSYSHIFRTGEKIRIKITNLDNVGDSVNVEEDPFLRTNPHVLPTLEKGTDIIFMNAANPSYIELPLIGYQPNSVTQNTEVTPNSFALSQNYPNPFNPSTKINFDIPSNFKGFVNLKVYDTVGRQVTTLVNNEKLTTGKYEVTFDGSVLSSGIYFYELTAGDYKEMKKMVLVK